jgi:Tape measure protein
MTLGDLIIRIGADPAAFAQLQQLLGQSQGQMEAFGQSTEQIGPTITEALAAPQATMNDLESVLEKLASSAQVTASAVTQIATNMDQAAAAAEKEAQQMESLRGTFEEIAAFGETLAFTEAIVDLAKEALVASGNLATVTAAMGMVMGSSEDAKTALEGLKDLALSSPFAFPDLIAAAQRLTAFGVEAEQLGPIIGSIADAAAATGKGIDQLTQAFSRVAQTGMITQRQLVQLGVTWQELGDVMGTSAEQAKAALTKGVLDSQTALLVLHDTVESVYGGAAQTISQTITSQFKILKQQVDFTLEGLGDALTPFAMQIVASLSEIPPMIDKVIAAFQALDPQTQQFIEVGAAIALAIGPAIAAVTGLALAIMAIGFAAPVMIPLAEAFAAIGVAVAAIHLSGLDQEVMTFIADLENNAAGIRSLFGDISVGIGNTQRALDGLQVGFGLINYLIGQGDELVKEFTHSGDLLAGTMGKIANITLGGFWSQLVNQLPGVEALRVSMTMLAAAAQYLGGSFDTMNDAAAAVSKTLQNTVASSMSDMAKDALAAADAQDRAFKQAQVGAQIAAAAAAQEAIALNNLNAKFQENAQFALEMYNGIADGTVQASTAVTKLTSVIEQGQKEMDSLNAGSAAMITGMLIPALKSAQATVQDIANGEALDKIANQILAIGDAADKITAKLPVDFQDMMAGVSKGVNFQGIETQLNTQINDMVMKLQTLPTALKESLGSGMQNDIDMWKTAAANLQNMLGALKLIGEDKSMGILAQEVQGLVTEQNAGQLTSAQWQAGLNGIGTALTKSVIPAMQAGVAITPALVTALSKIPDIGPALAQAAQSGIDPFTVAVQNMAEQTRASFLTIDTAMKDLGVTSMDAAALAVTKDGNDIIAILKGVADASLLSQGQLTNDSQAIIAWAQKVIVPMQNLGITISDDVLAQIAKISPAMAAAAAQGPGQLQQAIDQLKTQVLLDTASMTDAFKALGLQTVTQMQSSIALAQRYLEILESESAPMQAQLAAQISMYNAQLKYAQATGASADSALQLTQQLTAAKIQQDQLTQATMGLSTLYTGIVNAMGTAWTNLEKGIGDAIVAGQDFGKMFDNVLTQLKKSIAELVTTYLLNQLKAAILQNTNALGGFNAAFNAIFGSASNVMNATQKTAQATATQLGSLAQSVVGDADEVGGAAQKAASSLQQASQSMQGATAGIGQAAASLVSDLSLVAEAVGAIAGIIGDIEQARTNKLLGEIEVSTRGTLAQAISIQLTLNDLAAALQTIVDFNNDFWSTYFGQALGDLDAIAAATAQIASSGIGAGGGSGSGFSLADLTAALTTLETAITNSIASSTQQTNQTAIAANNVANIMAGTTTAVDNNTAALSTATIAIASTNTAVTAAAAAAASMGDALTAATSTLGAAPGLGQLPGAGNLGDQWTVPPATLSTGLYGTLAGSPGAGAGKLPDQYSAQGASQITIQMPIVGNSLTSLNQQQLDEITNQLMVNVKQSILLSGARVGSS